MPRIDYDEVFDREGNLLSRTERVVPDEVVELERLDEDLRGLAGLARKEAREWTDADVVAAVRLLLRERLRSDLLAP